jgi:hypothetical protein
MSDEYEVVYPSGNQTHICSKEDCYYCYYMNRPDKADIPARKNGWSENEVNTLLENYGKIKTVELAKILNKSYRALVEKIYIINKSKNNASAA